MRPVAVIWEDASDLDVGPWVDRATAAPPVATIFHQLGYLVSLTSTEVILTACMGDDAMGVRSRIPAGMVKSITELLHGERIAIPKPKRKRA